MKIRSRKTLSFILCVLISGTIALAGPKGKGNGKGGRYSDDRGSVSTHVGVGIFVGNDRDLIRHHYVPSEGTLPPGLAKRRGDLPPGLELDRRGLLSGTPTRPGTFRLRLSAQNPYRLRPFFEPDAAVGDLTLVVSPG